MRKDVRFALTVGGVFFCSIITYAIVLREGGNSLDQTEESVIADPATKPAVVAPAPATKPSKSTAVASGAKSNASPSPSTRRSDSYRSQYASSGGYNNYSSNYPTPATRPAPPRFSPPATKPDAYAAATSGTPGSGASGSPSLNSNYVDNTASVPARNSAPLTRTYASIDSPANPQEIEPQHTTTPSANRTDVLAARQAPAIVNSHPPLIDTPATRPMASSSSPNTLATTATPFRSPQIESERSVRTAPATRPNSTPSASAQGSANGTTTHKVMSGESLWTISNTVYGNGSYYNKIALANPAIDPKHLKVGAVLVIPDLAATPVAANSSVAVSTDSPRQIDETRQYRVQSGDTLERISAKLYGTPRVKDKIYDLNKSLIGDNPDKLKIGWVLNLPQPPRSAN